MIERKAYSVAEAAELIGISRSGIYSLCDSGKLRCLRAGQKIVIPREALDDYLGLQPDTAMRDAVADGVVLALQRLFPEIREKNA